MLDLIKEWAPLIVTVVTLAGGGIAWLFSRGKVKADTASVLTGSALNLVERLEARIDDVEEDLKEEREQRRLERDAHARTAAQQAGRIEALEKKVAALEKHNGTLTAHNKALTTENAELKLERERLQLEIERLRRGEDRTGL